MAGSWMDERGNKGDRRASDDFPDGTRWAHLEGLFVAKDHPPKWVGVGCFFSFWVFRVIGSERLALRRGFQPRPPSRHSRRVLVSASPRLAPHFWHRGEPSPGWILGRLCCTPWCSPWSGRHECAMTKQSNGELLPAACNSQTPSPTCHR